MEVVKRDGSREPVDFNKVLRRIEKMAAASSRELKVEPGIVAQKVIAGIANGIRTSDLDVLAAQTAAQMATVHPDYCQLAGNIAMSNLHKTTPSSFSQYVHLAYNHKDKNGQHAPLVSKDFYELVQANGAAFDAMVVNELDYEFDYFAYSTLANAYLIRNWKGEILERPGYMYLRAAIQVTPRELNLGEGVSGKDFISIAHLPNIKQVYNAMHSKWYTHATPTLFNSGTNTPQLSSCFLLDMVEDSISGIYETLARTAKISKHAGGIGIAVSKIRAAGSYIKGTGGTSNGLTPMLQVFNSTARYVDQGGGKRKGAFAVYLEPWHADIYDFLDLRKNHGKEELRARDLFTALWVPDLFMQRVEQDGIWSLFCPADVPQLTETYGAAFDAAYLEAEKAGKYRKQVRARDLMKSIVTAQIETGAPYMLYKDTVNEASNQSHHGVVRSSNLCFTGDTMVAVADGRNAVSIKELADWSKGKGTFPVYSARHSKAARGGWKTEVKNAYAFKSGTKEVVKVTLSNGDSFNCTPNHEIALADGTYVEAQNSVGCVLERFYTYTETDGKTPYRHINSTSNGHAKQHLLIYDFYNKGVRTKGMHIDHLDKNAKHFDAITNLNMLTAEQHRRKTGDEVRGTNNMMSRLRDPEKYKHNLSLATTGGKNVKFSGISNLELIEHGKAILARYGTINRNVYTQYRKETGIKLPLSFTDYRFKRSWKDYYAYVRGEKQYVEVADTREAAVYQDKDAPRREYLKTSGNPVVVSVEHLGTEDVYDLTVEDNNNFYIITSTEDAKYLNCQGVLVHNCAEITEVTNPDEVAVCNLASINLPKHLNYDVNGEPHFSFENLRYTVNLAVQTLNQVITSNYAPVDDVMETNKTLRPIGLGVQGLADVYMALGYAYDSPEAVQLNRDIFATMYYAAVKASVCRDGQLPYLGFDLSPLGKGKFHFERHRKAVDFDTCVTDTEWESLRKQVLERGILNSLLIALMPTASTSQIFGSTESFEPLTSNMYVRRTLAGEFVVVNRYMVADLEKLGLWSKAMSDAIIAEKGSIQNITNIPQDIKNRYKTVWETSMKSCINQAADRQSYVCQSQSMNLYLTSSDASDMASKLGSMHLYGWKQGLKTGMYYLRSKAAADPIPFTVEVEKPSQPEQPLVCTMEDGCISCGS